MARGLLSSLTSEAGPRPNGPVPDIRDQPREEFSMAKIMAFFVVLASFLLVAPVIESGTQSPVNIFHAVGNADSGGW
jgi:hypothetical protein